MRCLGLGSIYFEDSEAQKISQAWDLRGITARLTAGNYSFKIEPTNPVQIVLRKIGGGGGAHKQFWNGFRNSQSTIHQVILLSPALATLSSTQRQSADVDFTKLIQISFSDATNKSVDFDWLSRLRNQINYRFMENVWLMNWHHSSGLISNQETLINRYTNNTKVLPDAQRNFSKNHLTFVAVRFCQLITEATTELSMP